MPKRSSKPGRQKDTNELARQVLDAIAPDADKPASKAAKKGRAESDKPAKRGSP